MNKNVSALILVVFLLSGCSFPTAEEAGIKYSAQPAFQVPENIQWREVGLAKELINVKEKMVIISGGSNPLPIHHWKELKVSFPWQKNIDRNILINKTALVRSPNASSNCVQSDCFTEREYKDYSWIELAQPMAVDFFTDFETAQKRLWQEFGDDVQYRADNDYVDRFDSNYHRRCSTV